MKRRFSVQREALSAGTLNWVVPISNSFLVACPAEAGLVGAFALFKPHGIKDSVIAAIIEPRCKRALRAAIC